MYKCKLATTKENLEFIERFCRRPEKREQIIKHFRVDVEAYEELPPWHSVYNATGSDILLKDSIVMLRVSDLQKRVKYYPVFSEKLASKLLAKWGIVLPPKMTAFAYDNENEENINPENLALRHLLAFARLFMILQDHLHTPMPLGFNGLYQQLYDCPQCKVSPEVVRFVNGILGDFIEHHMAGCYVIYGNLQDFIIYIMNRYRLLVFKNPDFSCLREKMQQYYPNDKIYF